MRPHHTVQHLRADRLQHLGPVDVGFFVEAGLQLHHHGDFFAFAHGLTQQVHQLRIGAGAVDGLFDGQHVRVVHRLAQEGEHRVKPLKRLVDQCITRLQLLKEGLALADLYGPARLVGREQQFGLIDEVDQLRQAGQVHRTMHPVQRAFRQVELLEQITRQELGATRRHLQPHSLAVMAHDQAFAQRGAEVLHVVFIHRKVGVACDAELRKLADLTAWKQVNQVRTDHTGKRHQHRMVARHLGWQPDQAGQHPRYLDDGDFVFAPKSITATEAGNEVERLVGHLRERVGRVQAHRDQQRPHLALKVRLHPPALRHVALAMRQDLDAVAGKSRQKLVVVQRVLLGDQGVRGGGHGLKTGTAVGAFVVLTPRGTQVGCGAHLKELVKVGRDDAQVAEPLKQRHVGAVRPVKHPGIKSQDAVVSVQQSDGAWRCGGRQWHRCQKRLLHAMKFR